MLVGWPAGAMAMVLFLLTVVAAKAVLSGEPELILVLPIGTGHFVLLALASMVPFFPLIVVAMLLGATVLATRRAGTMLAGSALGVLIGWPWAFAVLPLMRFELETPMLCASAGAGLGLALWASCLQHCVPRAE